MDAFLASKRQFLDWLRHTAADTETFFPQPLGEASFQFARVRPDSPLRLEDWDSGTPREAFRASANPVPPGKLLSPPGETLFRFRRDPDGRLEFFPVLDDAPRIIAGIRPCDLHAIHLLDGIQSAGVPDPHYLSRRGHTTLIAHDCLQPCDEHCFCDAVGALRQRQGADLFLTPMEDGLLVEVLSEKGAALVEGAGFSPCGDREARLAWAEGQRARPFGRPLPASPEAIAGILAGSGASPVWREHSERCFSCGTCNLVCPTCYCFDVSDDIDLAAPAEGRRCRTWDGCMLPDFAQVAGGHDFRPGTAARQHHRVARKFQYLPRQMATGSHCVGCGRCGHQCTVDIDIYDIVKDLVERAGP